MKKSLFIVILMSIGLFFISACGRQKEREYEYDYYPDRNIYYSIERSKFHYSLDGGKTWENYNTGLGSDSKLLGRKEKIYTKNVEVWKDNATHLEMYEGKAVQLLTDADKSYVAATTEVTDKRTIARSGSTIKKPAAAPKKKGVRGFFKRVFGKKKKTTRLAKDNCAIDSSNFSTMYL